MEAATMLNQNEPKTIAELLHCLSAFEENIYQLYGDIARKTEMPFVRSLFEQIAIDSHKHSVILKGVSEGIAIPTADSKACEKRMGETWKRLAITQKEIDRISRINNDNLPWLVEKLAHFESAMGEEYFVFIQLKTLHMLVKEINQKYNIDLSHTKSLFTSIINDEDHHRELLETIKCLVTKKEKENDTSLVGRYESLDTYTQECNLKS